MCAGLYAGLWPTLLRDSFYSGNTQACTAPESSWPPRPSRVHGYSCACLCTGMSIVTYTRCKSLFAELLRQPTQAFSVQFLTGERCAVLCAALLCVGCGVWTDSLVCCRCRAEPSELCCCVQGS